MRRRMTRLITATTIALLAVAMLSSAAGARQDRSQSGKGINDACLQVWSNTVASYRVDWTSYFDGTTTWYGYVANVSNTTTAGLDGVDTFATPADLAGLGSTDSKPPVATVTPGWSNGAIIGSIGFYGRYQVTNSVWPYGLDTYGYDRALGSYTLCFSSIDSGRL